MRFLMERIIFHPIEKLHALKFFDKLSAYIMKIIGQASNSKHSRPFDYTVYMSISHATCSQVIA